MRSHGSLAIATAAASCAAALAFGPIAGCGGGGGGGGGAVAASTAAGVSSAVGVVATDPVDGEPGFDPAASLYITFDADVDAATIGSGAVTVLDDRGTVPSTARLITPRVVELDPARPLAFNKDHVLRVTTTVATAGGHLAADHLVKFRTQGPRVAVPAAQPTTTAAGAYVAGAAAVDITPPIGTPLGGYGGGDRRLMPPDLNPFNSHTFLAPSRGIHDPIMAKALVLGSGAEKVCILTLDAIATEANIVEVAVRKAQALGFTVPVDRVLCTASHTHSGPGAVSKKMFWQLAAADLFVSRVFEQMTDRIALALAGAERGLGPAHVGVGLELVTNATRNRRHGDSPDLDPDDIDPELHVIRVDRPDGTPVATVWNFAIHGTNFGTSMLDFSADVIGSANIKAEARGGGGICMFMQGCEGDIAPTGGYDGCGQVLSDAIHRARRATTTAPAGVVGSASEDVDFGQAVLDLSLARVGSQLPAGLANHGIVQALNRIGFGIGASVSIPNGWMETRFRFQALRIGKAVVCTFPGEPIHELGKNAKALGKGMGFDHVLTAGCANGHGAYWTSEKEYGYGGYEGLASFFGPKNGERLVEAARKQMDKLKP